MSHSPGSFLFPVKEAGTQPGGYSRFQVTDMIEWGQKSKPKKIPPDQNLTPKKPMLNFGAIKISEELHSQDMWVSYAGTITNLQIVLNTQQNPYLNQATQKSTCQTFPTQKKPEIKNFKPQKIVRLSLSLEIQSTSPGSWGSCLWQNMRIIPAPGC